MKTTETLLLLAASLSLVPIHGFAATRCVNLNSESPAPPYTTWATAATNIQDAIDVAVAGDEIVVTNGVYQTGGRVVFGAMTNRVAVTRPLTVRSVNGPEVTAICGYQAPGTTNGDDAVRCVYLTNGAVLTGFTLTNGATRRSSGDVREITGGGVWCESASAVLSNCALIGNSAYADGGGAYSGTLHNCALRGNSAFYGDGGGAAKSTVNNCTLTGNWAGGGGGGTYFGTLNNCALAGNSAYGGGGGASYGTLTNCTLTGNGAGYGGGANNSTLDRCTLAGNSASRSGYSSHGGGAAGGTLNNCALTGNSARERGGGASVSTLNNCTLTGNSAHDSGGGASGGILNNCIVYYNTTALGVGPNYHGGTLNYSCTTPLPPSGAGNISAEPQLASASHLSAGSPCLGAGHAAYSSGADIDGEPWANPPSIGCDEYHAGAVTGPLTVAIAASYTNVTPGFVLDFRAAIGGRASASRWEYDDGTVASNRPSASRSWAAVGDYPVVLRAYNESYPEGVSATVTMHVVEPPVHHVALDSSSPVAPYGSWATAATNIQDALDAATVPGALVLVSNGVYETGVRTVYGTRPNRVAVNKPLTVQSVNGPEVTVIRGGGVRCVYLTNGAALVGFTLTNGVADQGGGVWCESASAVVSNCTLAGNSAYEGGGAYGGALNHCALTGNSASDCGGGASDCTLNHCTLTGNSTGREADGGGAAFCTLNHCTLTGNSAHDGNGGGAFISSLNNCTLTGNTASHSAGGAAACTLNNCTLTGNWAGNAGGGAAGGRLNNCIVYYNLLSYGTNMAAVRANYDPDPRGWGPLQLNYCSTTPLPTNGTGNMTNEPAFMDRAAGNLRLASNSPCINAGDNAYAPDGPDLDGQPRIFNGTVDLGAYEFQNTRPLYVSSVMVTPTNQFVRPGSNVTFRVSAVSDFPPITCQWRLNGTNLPHATNFLLTVTNVQLANTGDYAVVVADSLGSVTSAPARLTVLILPVIVQQPVSQTVIVGGEVTLSVAVTNTATLPVTYRWRKGGIYVTTNILNERVSSFTLTNVQTNDAANYYNVAITNLAGFVPLSSSVTLTVITSTALPGVALTSPANGATFVCPTNVTLAADASDSDGSVSRVEFYAGTNRLGAATNAPYSLTWNNVPAGHYPLIARAIDNVGAVSNSAPINVTVIDPLAATLSIAREGSNVLLSWPQSCSNYRLEVTASFNPTNWAPSTAPVTAASGQWNATVPVTSTSSFFRLSRE